MRNKLRQHTLRLNLRKYTSVSKSPKRSRWLACKTKHGTLDTTMSVLTQTINNRCIWDLPGI